MKYRLIIMITMFVMLLISCKEDKMPYQNKNLPIEERVDDLIQRMTLEEKIEQLAGDDSERVDELSFGTATNKRLGIPGFVMADGPVGVREGKATAFPAGIVMAASWDTSLMHEIGVALGVETKAKGRNFLLGGCVNIHRNPLGGRNFESYGEDPYLSSQLIVPYIKGIQAQDNVTCVKHYACNNQEWERKEVDMIVDERTLHEIYFPMFKSAVQEAEAMSVMSSYNLLNGHHASENKYLLTDVLKEQWGFDGFVVSDWLSVYSTVKSANAGLDLEMPKAEFFGDKLLEAVEEGRVEESLIDDKVRRILKAKFRAGLFDSQRTPDSSLVNSHEHQQLARKVAEEGMILLKNDQSLLPFYKNSIKSIAVIGPNANVARTGGHGSSLVKPYYAVTPLQGIKNFVGDEIDVNFAIGEHLTEPELILMDSRYLTPPSGEGSGLLGEYYNNINFEGEPVFTRVDEVLDFNFKDEPIHEEFGKDSFAIRWSGSFVPPKTKEYKFDLNSDDGSRLYIDGELIVDNSGVHPPTIKSGNIHLEKGKEYPIVIEYEEIGYGAMFQLGWSPPFDFDSYKKQVAEAAEVAAGSDVVVLCAGSAAFIEGEGIDKQGLELPGHQDYLIEKIAEANPNTVVVLFGANPMVTKKWLDKVKGLLLAWFPGQEGGNALANILFGEVNPSGKLPFSYIQDYSQSPVFDDYKDASMKVHYDEGVFIGYRWLDQNDVEIKFPFGFGLSYTTFDYRDMKIEKHENNQYSVSVEIENTGDRKGEEIVLLFIKDIESSVPRPPKELKGFSKVALDKGERKMVTIPLDHSSFAYYNPESKEWIAEKGAYEVLVGSSSRSIHLSDKVILD